MRLRTRLLLAALLAPALLPAQRPTIGGPVRQFVTVDAPVVALRNVRVIDGTGAPAQTNQTIVVRDGVITAVGPMANVAVPDGAQLLDLTGKTVMPGLVMVHEHLFYPVGTAPVYAEQLYSFPRLYLGGGVTTMRTGGSMVPYADLNLRKYIDVISRYRAWCEPHTTT